MLLLGHRALRRCARRLAVLLGAGAQRPRRVAFAPRCGAVGAGRAPSLKKERFSSRQPPARGSVRCDPNAGKATPPPARDRGSRSELCYGAHRAPAEPGGIAGVSSSRQASQSQAPHIQMRLLSLSIDGFRGISHAHIRFGDNDVIIGPSGSGKSTIVDAISLAFGRTRLVRDLTEHDFYGSCPQATSRIRIVATVGGFDQNDPERNDGWFREGRAVPKWWDAGSGSAHASASADAPMLCAQLGFAARFDLLLIGSLVT